MANHFLIKSQIDLSCCLEFEGELAIEAYPKLYEFLTERAGLETAQLFAEPLVSRGNDVTPPSVSWYTDIEGNSRSFAQLDDEEQALFSADVGRRLLPMHELIQDPDVGLLVAAALQLTDPSDLWSIGGQPVVVNWGILPKDVAKEGVSRKTHYDRTLGRFLPLAAAPPLTDAEREMQAPPSSKYISSPSASTPQTTGSTGKGLGGVLPLANQSAKPNQSEQASNASMIAAAHNTRRPSAHSRPPFTAWLPLVILLTLASVFLIWLLIPGNRIFPIADKQVVTDEAALATQTQVNIALKERLTTLTEALDAATCHTDGTLLLPDGRTIEGLLPPNPNDPSDEATPKSMLSPNPARIRVSQGLSPTDSISLLDHIKGRTAMIAVPSDGGLSSGSGFFISPNLVVTNHHVIADGDSERIFVTNASLGSLKKAEVVKTRGPIAETGRDFALLRVEDANEPVFDIFDSTNSLRLQSVVAAGYPGDFLQFDSKFQRLQAGDKEAVPDLILTDGKVSVQQSISENTSIVVHSASISTGNSGGPLVDMCGRLVGVNTLVKRGKLRDLNLALATEDLLEFVADTEALPQVVSRQCSPNIERPQVRRAPESE